MGQAGGESGTGRRREWDRQAERVGRRDRQAESDTGRQRECDRQAERV